jgi:hypothetical protein
MKQKIISVLLFSIATFPALAQTFKGDNSFSLGTYRTFSGFFNTPNQSIITASYERRLSMLNRRVGLGLKLNTASSPNINQKDFVLGPNVYGHFLQNPKFDLYAGLGVAYGKQTTNDGLTTLKEGATFRYLYGVRAALPKGFFVGTELANYRYTSGIYVTWNVGFSF